MLPDPAHPERGSFVRDQVAALSTFGGLDVQLYEFPPGAGALVRAALALRRRSYERFDVVHAHFGLTAWPALSVPAHVRGHAQRGPGGQAEVRVHDVEALVAAPAQRQRGSHQRAGAGRELVQLHVEAAERAQRGDLIADEAAALRTLG